MRGEEKRRREERGENDFLNNSSWRLRPYGGCDFPDIFKISVVGFVSGSGDTPK